MTPPPLFSASGRSHHPCDHWRLLRASCPKLMLAADCDPEAHVRGHFRAHFSRGLMPQSVRRQQDCEGSWDGPDSRPACPGLALHLRLLPRAFVRAIRHCQSSEILAYPAFPFNAAVPTSLVLRHAPTPEQAGFEPGCLCTHQEQTTTCAAFGFSARRSTCLSYRPGRACHIPATAHRAMGYLQTCPGKTLSRPEGD